MDNNYQNAQVQNSANTYSQNNFYAFQGQNMANQSSNSQTNQQMYQQPNQQAYKPVYQQFDSAKLNVRDMISYILVIVANLCVIGFIFLPQLVLYNADKTEKESGYFVSAFKYFIDSIKEIMDGYGDKYLLGKIVIVTCFVLVMVLPCITLLKSIIALIRSIIRIVSAKAANGFAFSSLKSSVVLQMSLILVYDWYGYMVAENEKISVSSFRHSGIGFILTAVVLIVFAIIVAFVSKSNNKDNEQEKNSLKIVNYVFGFIGVALSVVALFLFSYVTLAKETSGIGTSQIAYIFINMLGYVGESGFKVIEVSKFVYITIVQFALLIMFLLNLIYLGKTLKTLFNGRFAGVYTIILGFLNLFMPILVYVFYYLSLDKDIDMDLMSTFIVVEMVFGLVEIILGITYMIIMSTMNTAKMSVNNGYVINGGVYANNAGVYANNAGAYQNTNAYANNANIMQVQQNVMPNAYSQNTNNQ